MTMSVEIFLQQFEQLNSGPDEVQKIRELILRSAHSGLLTADTESSYMWQRLTLDVASRIFSGNSISVAEKAAKYEGCEVGLPYIATKDVEGWHGQINYQTGIRIPLGEESFRVAPRGSVLICAEGGSAGRKLGLVNQDVCFGNKLFCVVPGSDQINQKFLLRIFQFPEFQNAFAASMSGIIGGISLGNFKNLQVSFPNLQSQDIINQKVDHLFALCDEIEVALRRNSELKLEAANSLLSSMANAEGAQETSKIWSQIIPNFSDLFDAVETKTKLRDAILQLAVSGRLNENSLSGNKLKSISADEHDTRSKQQIKPNPKAISEKPPFTIPRDWVWRPLSELVNPSKPISYGVIKLGPDVKDGIPILRCSDVRYRTIDLTSVKKIAPEIEVEYKRTRLSGGEVLVNIRGTLGGCAVVPSDLSGYNIAREVAVIDPNSGILPSFLLAVFSSPYFQQKINSNLKGIAYKGLNLGTLSTFLIPVPPKKMQAEIVKQIDHLMLLCEQVEKLILIGQKLISDLLASLIHGLNAPDPGGGVMDVSLKSKTDSITTIKKVAGGFQSESSRVFKLKASPDQSGQLSEQIANKKAVPSSVDSKFKEAVLVGAIVNTFFDDGGEPIGNFRLQKAVYFARRHNGEDALDKAFLKKAAGPYNPAMKYSGGIAISKSKNWLREAKGRYGFGHVPGSSASELTPWVEKYAYADSARWVCETFKLRKNEEWEILATVDYAIEHLRTLGIEPDAAQILQYIEADDEWRPKIAKLNLTEFSVQSAMIEVAALFAKSAIK